MAFGMVEAKMRRYLVRYAGKMRKYKDTTPYIIDGAMLDFC
jgi:hypothetical protein